MRVCVLQSSYEHSNAPFKDFDPYCDPATFFPKEYQNITFERVLIGKATAAQQVRDLSTKGYDCFINLCDGAFDEDRAGFEVVQLLEKYNLPFTGADSTFYEPSKELMKMMAHYYGVRTPAFTFAFNEEDIEDAHNNLNYPMIIKHYNGYSSVGMTRNSRVTNRDELYDQARKMIVQYEGALIEEFIDGREFTVLVGENPENPNDPISFNPIECIFSNGETFKHFDLKWKEFSHIHWVPCTDDALAKQLIDMSKKIFVALGGVGYGRTDMRVNDKGEAFFLEINPNCGIFYPAPEEQPDALGSADFILLNSEMKHTGFVEHIIRCAIERAKKREKKAEVRFKAGHGYCWIAAKNIPEGELIKQHEEKGTYLVSKKHVHTTWTDPLKKQWFEQYSWPVTDEIWCMWSEDPNEWIPVNHSCDPNAWLNGLDVVARRAIKKGEQITMDYATFCADNMQTFECKCKFPQCRKSITGKDYLQPFVEQYGTHVSDYVHTKRQQQKKEHSNGN